MVEAKKQGKGKQPAAAAEEAAGGGKKLNRLKELEAQMQEQFDEQKLYEAGPTKGCEKMSFDAKQDAKFMATFPYPYMNGYLHLGHGFSMSKAEFATRYQRQTGKNVLFPFGFHCTGQPISAAAVRLEREIANNATSSNQPTAAELKELQKKNPDYKKPSLTQFEVLKQSNIPEEEIPLFQDPNHWLDYFPPLGQAVLSKLGVHTDWRRSFITTERNPYYDAFIRWQFHHLNERGKIKFGKRNTIYSVQDGQPVADHDRARQEDEGVGPQEYTGIKLKLLDMPASLNKKFKGKTLYMVAATLRPETMYGQTNCFVLPEGEYGVFKMANNEHYVMSERAAKNMAYQELTAEEKVFKPLATVKGTELIGKRVKAPLTTYEHVFVLPLPTISMVKGTGIVTSVPSDAPHDYQMLVDLQTKAKLRSDLGVDEAWVKDFAPIPIIEIPGMGDLSAKHACEELKIQGHKDHNKLNQAKDLCYQKGFLEGVCIVGAGKGMKVEEAKPVVKQLMVESGEAFLYFEPEKEVLSRTGDSCIVALVDQYLLQYGEESWKNKVKEHVESENFQTYNPKTQHEFNVILEWLREWGCSRNTGLGTKVPWDKQFVIESLSDSTIYMAYYTIAHQLQGSDNMDGSKTGPAGIKPEQLTTQAFDYIFLGKSYNKKKCGNIPENKLKDLKREFEYWYPMDLRVSAKDLIRNHLTMSLYNHQAIWEDPKKMARSYFCNGYITINGEKMSKSTGNFMLLSDCLERFGADATRMAFADCGDGLDDANFDTTVANAAILKLFTFEEWIQKHVPTEGCDFSANDPSKYSTWDKIVLNEINHCISECKQEYDSMRYKNVCKIVFSDLLPLKETYQMACKDTATNPYIIFRYLETVLQLMNPIAPHFAQYAWQTYVLPALKKSKNATVPGDSLVATGWPKMNDLGSGEAGVDASLLILYSYLKDNKHTFQLAYDKTTANKKMADADTCTLFVGLEFPEYKKQVLQILKDCPYDKSEGITGDYKKQILDAFKGDKKQQGVAQQFAAFVAKRSKELGRETALRDKMQFDEVEVLKENQAFLFENMRKVKTIRVLAKEDNKEKSAEMIAGAAVPGNPSCMFTCSTAAAGQEEDKQPGGGKKGKQGKGGKQAEAPKEKPAKAAAPAKGGKGGSDGGADGIESQLAKALWLGGQQPSAADREAFEGMASAPNPETHPSAFAWWLLVSKFTPAVRGSWGGAAAEAPKGKAEGKGKGKKEEKKPAKEEEDDMDDLFGSEDEEEAAAAKEAAMKAAEAGKKKKKAPPVAKSVIVWDVKPWGPEVDLDELGQKIITEIKMDGLLWKTEFKKEPVAFGVYKICIGATVEDEKVSTDDIQEQIEAFEDHVQSVDIVSFNKL